MKTLVYPLTYSNREMALYSEQIVKFDEIVFVTKDNTGPYYKKLVDAAGITDCRIEEIFDLAMKECDVILLLEGDTCRESYVSKIELAIEMGKKIYISSSIYKMIREYIDVDAIELLESLRKKENIEKTKILNIDVPVIGIMGLGKHCDKFICELHARKYFMSLGYKILQFGSKECSPVFGFESLPEYILDNKIPMIDRSVSFNHYLVEKIQSDKPDIIIIGMPEGIMPLSNNILNDFGENAQVISNAVPIDYTILGMYYQEKIDGKFIEYLIKYLEFKFSTQLAAICISKTSYETIDESFGEELKYYHLDVSKNFNYNIEIPYPIPYFNVDEVDKMNKSFSEIYNCLVQNIDTI